MATLKYGDDGFTSPQNNRKIKNWSEWESDDEYEPSYKERLEQAPTKKSPPPGRYADI